MQIRTLSHANPLYSWCLTPVFCFKKHCFFFSLEDHDSSHAQTLNPENYHVDVNIKYLRQGESKQFWPVLKLSKY